MYFRACCLHILKQVFLHILKQERQRLCNYRLLKLFLGISKLKTNTECLLFLAAKLSPLHIG